MKCDQDGVLLRALGYLRRGWSIIPIKAGDKKPDLRTWKKYQDEPPTEATVRRWFPKGTDRSIGIICGPVSGNLVIRDFDDPDAYKKWKADHPELARTLPTVATGRGYHVYFRADINKIKHCGDGELRGKGYCLAPPSVHPNGKPYRWIIPLPDGDLPNVDPNLFGLADFTECTEEIEVTEDPEAIVEGGVVKNKMKHLF
jgi:Bifunctional DNA primase/polymerase, N-terminal